MYTDIGALTLSQHNIFDLYFTFFFSGFEYFLYASTAIATAAAAVEHILFGDLIGVDRRENNTLLNKKKRNAWVYIVIEGRGFFGMM